MVGVGRLSSLAVILSWSLMASLAVPVQPGVSLADILSRSLSSTSKRSPVPLMSVRRQERKNSRDSPIYFIKLPPSQRYLNNEILEHNKISDHPPATAVSERKSMKKVHFMTNGKPSLLHFLKNNLSPPSTKKQETLESRMNKKWEKFFSLQQRNSPTVTSTRNLPDTTKSQRYNFPTPARQLTTATKYLQKTPRLDDSQLRTLQKLWELKQSQKEEKSELKTDSKPLFRESKISRIGSFTFDTTTGNKPVLRITPFKTPIPVKEGKSSSEQPFDGMSSGRSISSQTNWPEFQFPASSNSLSLSPYPFSRKSIRSPHLRKQYSYNGKPRSLYILREAEGSSQLSSEQGL